MNQNKPMAKMMRLLITLLGAGVGAAVAALAAPVLSRLLPDVFGSMRWLTVLYAGLCALFALVFFLMSGRIIDQTMRLIAKLENRWSKLSTRQIVFASLGLLMGLFVAFLLSQLVLSPGASLLTISMAALAYLVLGFVGLRVGLSRGRRPSRRSRAQEPGLMGVAQELIQEAEDELFDGEDAPAADAPYQRDHGAGSTAMRKYLDTSVIIDGRIADVARAGFLEGEIVVPAFVLAELRHIADSADNLRRARGRRGLDVLNQLQKMDGHTVIVDDTDYTDIDEVDVKLLRLCREKGGSVMTNDYNLNKVAGVTGIRVLNINDLANAVKPMLVAGEELMVQVVREGKEPGQGVSFLDDGTMIVIEAGRRYVGEQVPVVVTTVLQTSAGRMIFARLKESEEKGA